MFSFVLQDGFTALDRARNDRQWHVTEESNQEVITKLLHHRPDKQKRDEVS